MLTKAGSFMRSEPSDVGLNDDVEELAAFEVPLEPACDEGNAQIGRAHV